MDKIVVMEDRGELKPVPDVKVTPASEVQSHSSVAGESSVRARERTRAEQNALNTLTKKRVARKGIVTQRRNLMDRMMTEGCSRTALRRYRDELNQRLADVEAVTEEMEKLQTEDEAGDNVRYLDEIRQGVLQTHIAVDE